MNLVPLGDRLIVEPKTHEEKTASGLYLPDTAKEKPQEGKVLAAGEGKLTEEGKKLPMQVKVGDSIIYGKYSGTEVKIDGKEYLILSEKDVLAIIK